jgi:hypothetical protein
MPRTGSFRYEVRARGDVAEVVSLLSEFKRHRELHPLIVDVTERPAPAGVLRRYAITDRVPVLGPVRLPVTYVADVLVAGPDRVLTEARQRPATVVRNDTRLRVVDGEVVADVEITLTTPTLLWGTAWKQAVAAHGVLAERLAAVLNRRSPRPGAA